MGKIIVIFEVTPTTEGKIRYLELAAELKTILADTKGFINAERFQSLNDKSKILSVNLWEDEESAMVWRNQAEHRMAQLEGKNSLFSSYKITVADVVREYTNLDREEAPVDSNDFFANHKNKD